MPSPIEVILIPAIMIIVGLILKHMSVLKEDDREILTKIVLNISLPSMIFINLYDAHISHDMMELPLIALTVSFLLVCIAYLYCKMRGYSKKTTWTILIASSMMNTGFIGFPVCLGVFGNEGFLNAIFFDLSTTVLFISYGMLLANEYGGNKKEVLINALKFMPLWGVIFAIIFNVFNIPLIYVAENVLDYFGQSTIPLIMLALGLSLDFRSLGNSLSDSIAVSIIKLVLGPIICFSIMTVLKISGMTFNIGILEAGMSTALNALVLSIMYDLDSDLMSSMIFTNIILSLFTLTTIISFLT